MAGGREEAWIWERSSGRAAARLHETVAGGCCRVSSSGEWRAEVRWDGFGKGALGGQRRAALDEIWGSGREAANARRSSAQDFGRFGESARRRRHLGKMVARKRAGAEER